MNNYNFVIPAAQVDLLRVALETMIQQASELHANMARQVQEQQRHPGDTPPEG